MHVLRAVILRLLVVTVSAVALWGQFALITALSGGAGGGAGELLTHSRPVFLPLVVTDGVVALAAAVLALWLAFGGDRARGMDGLAVALAAWSYLLAYPGIVLALRPDPGFLRTLYDLHFVAVELAGLAGIVRFTSRFPERLDASRVTDPSQLPVWLAPLQRLRIALLADAGPWMGALLALVALAGVEGLRSGSVEALGLNPGMDLLRFLAVTAVVLNVRRAWVVGGEEARQRLGWLVFGLALLVGAVVVIISGNVFLAATGWQEPPLAWRPITLDLGFLGFLTGVALAAFYRGPASSLEAAARATAYIGTATLVLLLATALEVLLTRAFTGRVSLPSGSGAVLGVVLGAAAYRHVVPRVESAVRAVHRQAAAAAEATSG